MKISKRQLRRIIKEYASSHEEKASAADQKDFASNVIMDLEHLVDQNSGNFSDAEFRTLEQALQILQKIIR